MEETGADGKDSEVDEAILISPTGRQKRSTFLKAVEKVKKDVVLSEKKPEKEFNDKVSDKKPTSSTTTSTSSAPRTAIINGRVVTTPVVVLSSCTIPGKMNVLHIWKRGTLQVIVLAFWTHLLSVLQNKLKTLINPIRSNQLNLFICVDLSNEAYLGSINIF